MNPNPERSRTSDRAEDTRKAGNKYSYCKQKITRKKHNNLVLKMIDFEVGVVLPAAGTGERLGGQAPKQFFKILVK